MGREGNVQEWDGIFPCDWQVSGVLLPGQSSLSGWRGWNPQSLEHPWASRCILRLCHINFPLTGRVRSCSYAPQDVARCIIVRSATVGWLVSIPLGQSQVETGVRIPVVVHLGCHAGFTRSFGYPLWIDSFSSHRSNILMSCLSSILRLLFCCSLFLKLLVRPDKPSRQKCRPGSRVSSLEWRRVALNIEISVMRINWSLGTLYWLAGSVWSSSQSSVGAMGLNHNSLPLGSSIHSR